MKIDLTSKNAAIAIILALDLLFFVVAVSSTLFRPMAQLAEKIWPLFLGTNSGLFLILNGDSKQKDSSATDGSPANPTK